MNLENLRSFNVDAGIDGRPSGIVHSVFQMSDWEKMHTCNAFRHLTKIVLHVNATIPSDGGWTNTLIYAKIQPILGSARSLAHLDLGLDPPLDIPRSAVSELPALLGTHCWPHLHTLNLRNMIVLEIELVEFLHQHTSSFGSFSIHYVLLFGAKFDSYDQRRLWQSGFRSISVIPLTQLLIEIRFVSDEGDSVDRYWHESDATTINQFLV